MMRGLSIENNIFFDGTKNIHYKLQYTNLVYVILDQSFSNIPVKY